MDWLRSAYSFELPPELIAQHPAAQRDHSRLMRLPRIQGSGQHHHFHELPQLLPQRCALVFNNTRVVPARLLGRRSTGARIEALLLEEHAPGIWQALVRKAGRIKPGEELHFGLDQLLAVARERLEDGSWLLQFDDPEAFSDRLEAVGLPPLPPYIERRQAVDSQHSQDRERYQTVYASQPGAVAAPTAGLHFTPELLGTLKEQGHELLEVTLHVGRGTFASVEVEDVREHQMHAEHYEVQPEVWRRLQELKQQGVPVLAVGTTSVRVLETVAAQAKPQWSGWTEIFIYPPYRFRIVDHLLTNFHLPESTLLMLVSALCGRERLMNAYAEAVREHYRFFSYGDSMLIL